jgi:hypothetical protein
VNELQWEYRPEWCAWWLMLPVSGVEARRGYGPFNATEAAWASEVHGVPLPPPPTQPQGEEP